MVRAFVPMAIEPIKKETQSIVDVEIATSLGGSAITSEEAVSEQSTANAVQAIDEASKEFGAETEQTTSTVSSNDVDSTTTEESSKEIESSFEDTEGEEEEEDTEVSFSNVSDMIAHAEKSFVRKRYGTE